jgi:hypothetical protein
VFVERKLNYNSTQNIKIETISQTSKVVTLSQNWCNAQNCNEKKYSVDAWSHVLLKDKQTIVSIRAYLKRQVGKFLVTIIN